VSFRGCRGGSSAYIAVYKPLALVLIVAFALNIIGRELDEDPLAIAETVPPSGRAPPAKAASRALPDTGKTAPGRISDPADAKALDTPRPRSPPEVAGPDVKTRPSTSEPAKSTRSATSERPGGSSASSSSETRPSSRSSSSSKDKPITGEAVREAAGSKTVTKTDSAARHPTSRLPVSAGDAVRRRRTGADRLSPASGCTIYTLPKVTRWIWAQPLCRVAVWRIRS
jgi:hypothetical protein